MLALRHYYFIVVPNMGEIGVRNFAPWIFFRELVSVENYASEILHFSDETKRRTPAPAVQNHPKPDKLEVMLAETKIRLHLIVAQVVHHWAVRTDRTTLRSILAYSGGELSASSARS